MELTKRESFREWLKRSINPPSLRFTMSFTKQRSNPYLGYRDSDTTPSVKTHRTLMTGPRTGSGPTRVSLHFGKVWDDTPDILVGPRVYSLTTHTVLTDPFRGPLPSWTRFRYYHPPYTFSPCHLSVKSPSLHTHFCNETPPVKFNVHSLFSLVSVERLS